MCLLEQGLPQNVISFTPGFSPVKKLSIVGNRFNGFGGKSGKPLKRFHAIAPVWHRAKARCE
jgi:hypothetical protein